MKITMQMEICFVSGLARFTLVRAHQARLKDERAFRLEGTPDMARGKRSREEE